MTIPTQGIPPSQLFRALLLHMLETHRILIPHVQSTTSKELKACHMQNAYILSEIGSWLQDLTEDTDLTPSFSAAHAAEALAGVGLCLMADQAPTPVRGVLMTPSVPAAPQDRPLGISRAASSRRRGSTPPVWERSSDGRIIFPPKS